MITKLICIFHGVMYFNLFKAYEVMEDGFMSSVY
jgi:hypothetical protein